MLVIIKVRHTPLLRAKKMMESVLECEPLDIRRPARVCEAMESLKPVYRMRIIRMIGMGHLNSGRPGERYDGRPAPAHSRNISPLEKIGMQPPRGAGCIGVEKRYGG